jgi:hypothetical protein
MKDIPVDELWQWWRELAKREVELERQYEPLLHEHAEVHGKRLALENLISQGRAPTIGPEIASKWEALRREQQMPSAERKPPDVAHDVLSRKGAPMHYREILEEVRRSGVVIGGHDPGTTLIAYLGRDKRFSKATEVGRGYWGLAEWKSSATT